MELVKRCVLIRIVSCDVGAVADDQSGQISFLQGFTPQELDPITE